MTFGTYFWASSYAMILCAALALAMSEGVGLSLLTAFALVMLFAWVLEGKRWQLSERVGLVIVLLSLPLFYLDWKYQMGIGEAREKVGVSALAHLTLFLSAVKLLQIKADRDWVFLYLISFFEVLLAAGLSISPLFLLILSLYTLCALSTILAFEVKKARRAVSDVETRLLVAPDSTLFRRLMKRDVRRKHIEVRRLPFVAGLLLVLIFTLALPLFFVVPRSGAAALTRGGSGLAGFIGFSDSVTLGAIGRLQQNNRVVMRVRLEGAGAERRRDLRWRGVALDEFNGRGWRRTRIGSSSVQMNNERSFFQLGTTEGLQRLTTQTFFVEPIDTPVLFAAPRVIALQGTLPYVRLDAEGSLSTRLHSLDRVTYKAYSDTTEPDASLLRADTQDYPPGFARYLQTPKDLDPRIKALAQEVVLRARARNRYDAARAIEAYLQSEENYHYTLDLKAGGSQPLTDFLFHVREGHCEYFATAMAVMLRTLGVATRVVNGFQTGEYNDTADVYTVTQKDAHSWVEVYFPRSDSWVTFDPTPPAGRPVRESTGLQARLGKYAEAFGLLWAQYVVGYDKQEQRSLAASLRSRLFEHQKAVGGAISRFKTALAELLHRFSDRGDAGGGFYTGARGVLLVLLLITALPLALMIRRLKRLGVRSGLKFWAKSPEGGEEIVDFYRRTMHVLAARGLQRAADETPLEFASAAGIPEVLAITRAYNRVRYGEQNLSPVEAAEIEAWLTRAEEGLVTGDK